jgi:hypothetical protein
MPIYKESLLSPYANTIWWQRREKTNRRERGCAKKLSDHIAKKLSKDMHAREVAKT